MAQWFRIGVVTAAAQVAAVAQVQFLTWELPHLPHAVGMAKTNKKKSEEKKNLPTGFNLIFKLGKVREILVSCISGRVPLCCLSI